MAIKLLSDLVTVVSEHISNPSTSGFEIFVGLEHYDAGEPVITRFGSTANLESSVKHFIEGDILVARRNVYLKRAGVVKFEGVTSGDSIVLRVKDECYKDIIPFILNTEEFWDYAEQNSDGTMSKRLAPDVLLEYECDIPDNHKDIAKKLWAAYELKEAYKKMIAATDEMVKSQFIEMFSSAPKVGINNLVDTVWGSSPDSKTYNDIGEGVPFYQGKTEFGDLYINAPVTYCTAPIKMAKANAILMSVRAPVGAVNIATQDCCIGRGLASITPKEGKSTTMFVYYALKYMEEELDRLGTGSTFKAINKESYAKIQMPDAKISEQNKFVSIAEQADKSKYIN